MGGNRHQHNQGNNIHSSGFRDSGWIGLDLIYILDEVSDDEVDELEELLRIKNNINKKIKR